MQSAPFARHACCRWWPGDRTVVVGQPSPARMVRANSPVLATSTDCVTPPPPAVMAPKSSPEAGVSIHLRA